MRVFYPCNNLSYYDFISDISSHFVHLEIQIEIFEKIENNWISQLLVRIFNVLIIFLSVRLKEIGIDPFVQKNY